MTADLEDLVARATAITMTPEQERAQHVSFAFGNTHIENARITRQMIEDAEARLAGEDATTADGPIIGK